MPKYSLEMYAKRTCINGVPVCTTKWHIEAENIEEAKKIAERIRNRLARGTDEIQFRNLKEE